MVVGLHLGEVLELGVRPRMSQHSLSVLCRFVAIADCIRSGYVGGQFVITRNILSFFFLHQNYIGSPSEFKYAHIKLRSNAYGRLVCRPACES